MSGIDGEWTSTHQCGKCWYNGVWVLKEDGDHLTVTELKGTCCGCLPNCIKKTHNMKKVGPNRWEGRKGFKPIYVEIKSPNELEHLTTDGMCRLTRG